jgi:hypothetical protein
MYYRLIITVDTGEECKIYYSGTGQEYKICLYYDTGEGCIVRYAGTMVQLGK